MQQVRLIADSGGTKADWALIVDGVVSSTFSTRGINPIALGDEDVYSILRSELLPHLGRFQPVSVSFYGAGCRPSQCARMEHLLSTVLPGIRHVSVSSDLLGAARALFGGSRGIACILGTGANSGFYDGHCITHAMPALGYAIGDEGSGASLGKRLVADVFKRQLPPTVCQAFSDEYRLNADQLVENVYRRPAANRYLASFVPFISSHLSCPELRNLVLSDFEAFFRRNVLPLSLPYEPIGFVGGVAHHFAPLLRQAAANCGLSIASIIERPFEQLENL